MCCPCEQLMRVQKAEPTWASAEYAAAAVPWGDARAMTA